MKNLSWRSILQPVFSIFTCAMLVLAGCGGSGGGGGSTSPGGGTGNSSTLTGTVKGGQTPVKNSTIVLWASGQGGAAKPIGKTTADASGNFSISYTNPGGSYILYVTAYKGDAGSGSNNQLQMISLVGVAESIASSVSLTINELTTVAFTYIFASVYSSDGVVWATSEHVDIANSLVDFSQGSIRTTDANLIASLILQADALSSCVQSDGSSGGACDLIKNYSHDADDVFLAIVNWVTNRSSVNWAGLYALAQSAPIYDDPNHPISNLENQQPLVPYVNLTANGTANAFVQPKGIAIDGQCNVWVGSEADPGYVTEIKVSEPGFPAIGWVANNFNAPINLAADSLRNVWVASNSPNSEGKATVGYFQPGSAMAIQAAGTFYPVPNGGIAGDPTNSSGMAWFSNGPDTNGNTYLSNAGFFQTYYQVNNPGPMAVDQSGNIFVIERDNNTLVKIPAGTTNGTQVIGTCAVEDSASAIAVDGNGRVWITNILSDSITLVTDVDTCAKTTYSNPQGATYLDGPSAIAIDNSNNIWVANSVAISGITYVTKAVPDDSGNLLLTNYSVPGGAVPVSLAIDPLGDLWVVNNGNNTVTVLFGVASPGCSCSPINSGSVWTVPQTDVNWDPPTLETPGAPNDEGGWGLDWSGFTTGVNFFR